jgi:alpha-tubulin suppressor-like RCC1 family protein
VLTIGAALDSNGNLWAWGDNMYSQLANDTLSMGKHANNN